MSTLSRAVYRKKFKRALAITGDEAFFVLAWATVAIQSGRESHARKFLRFPPDAVTTEMSAKYRVHPWKLETLLNEILVSPKQEVRTKKATRALNCTEFSAMVHLVQLLTELENAEDGVRLVHMSIFREMHRLAHRQFEWQRGFMSYSQFYRWAFIYGGERTKAFFEEKYGFSISNFALVGFAIQATLNKAPAILRRTSLQSIGVSPDLFARVLDLICIEHSEARKRASALRAGNMHTAYKRSLLRQYPCVSFGPNNERVHGPLLELISLRCTAGVFYDVVNGGDHVKNEIADRYEQYCSDFVCAALPSSVVKRSEKYHVGRNEFDTPDVLALRSDELQIIFECKATRMSYEARFSENPIGDAERAYNEIAKGVFQVWRFVSHCRRGYYQQAVSDGCRGVVLTLDSWMSMSFELQTDILLRAREMAKARDPEISEADQIPILFTPFDILEDVYATCTEDSFYETVRCATDEKFGGWQLTGVHDQILKPTADRKEFLFKGRMAEYLPWWSNFTRDPRLI